MKAIDYPPVWLVGFLVLTWGLTRLFPQTVGHMPLQGTIAGVLLVAGVVLMMLAVWEMARAKTTIIPRHDPNALVTGGIFRFTRNPIYLGDLLVLVAGIVWWGSVGALVLPWIFARVIEARFIEGEEEKMRTHFGSAFEKWSEKTRRWV